MLAVKATYKRKVRGTVLGSSKTGSIIYIEPLVTEQYSRELSHLLHEEREEIRRILLRLTNTLRPFAVLLSQEQDYLVTIDVIAAKAYFAKETHALLPELTQERVLELRDAYHPLLYLSNTKKPIKNAMVTDTGGVNDQSFNQSAYEGLKELQKEGIIEKPTLFEVVSEPAKYPTKNEFSLSAKIVPIRFFGVFSKKESMITYF